MQKLTEKVILYSKEQLLTTITILNKCFLFLQEVQFGGGRKSHNIWLVTEQRSFCGNETDTN